MTDPRHLRGAQGEEAAVQALQRQGYRVVERNFSCRAGELDIIAEQGDVLCFVEVRTRRRNGLVSPASSITRSKRLRLLRAAQYFCKTRGVRERAMRFDVVSVSHDGHKELAVEIIPNAFDAMGRL